MFEVGLVLATGQMGAERVTQRWAELRAMALRAEGMGFDTVWSPDELLWRPEGAKQQGVWDGIALAGANRRSSAGPDEEDGILTAEEIVDEAIIRSDPNRTLIPDFIVHAVVHEPWAAHPSYTQGYYDRDNEFYVAWDGVTKEHDSSLAYLQEGVYGVEARAAYVKKLGPEKLEKRRPKPLMSVPVNYGSV